MEISVEMFSDNIDVKKYKLKGFHKDVKIRITLRGFSNSSPVSAESTAQLLECLPLRHVAPIKVIEYRNEEVHFFRKGVLMRRFKGAFYDAKERKIIIYGTSSKDLFCHALMHEIGHAVFLHCLTPVLRKKWVLKLSGRRSNFFVSLYAQRNAGEDFAECYAFYINEPEALKTLSRKYDFFDRHVFELNVDKVKPLGGGSRFDFLA